MNKDKFSKVFKNEKLNSIFSESLNKLNDIIHKLDNSLGTVHHKHPKSEITTNAPKKENIHNKEPSKSEEAKQHNEKKKETNVNTNKKQGDANELFKDADFRVGKITKISDMKDSEKVYVLKVDLGEGSLRDIGTGLRQYVKSQELDQSFVVVWANLKQKKNWRYFV